MVCSFHCFFPGFSEGSGGVRVFFRICWLFLRFRVAAFWSLSKKRKGKGDYALLRALGSFKRVYVRAHATKLEREFGGPLFRKKNGIF